MADTEFSNKLNAGLRYGATAAGTGFTILAIMSLLSADQVADLKHQLEILNSSIVTGYGALVKMWVILGPIAVGVAAKLGWSSSSVQGLASKLVKIASGPASPAAVEAQKAIVEATSTIANDKTIPASASASGALIAATNALPEVANVQMVKVSPVNILGRQ